MRRYKEEGGRRRGSLLEYWTRSAVENGHAPLSILSVSPLIFIETEVSDLLLKNMYFYNHMLS